MRIRNNPHIILTVSIFKKSDSPLSPFESLTSIITDFSPNCNESPQNICKFFHFLFLLQDFLHFVEFDGAQFSHLPVPMPWEMGAHDLENSAYR